MFEYCVFGRYLLSIAGFRMFRDSAILVRSFLKPLSIIMHPFLFCPMPLAAGQKSGVAHVDGREYLDFGQKTG